MGTKRKPKPARNPEVAYRDDQQATESLPLPIVSYPGHYGAFFAYSSIDTPKRLCFCSCAQPAITNYLALTSDKPANAYPHRQAPLDSHHFPLQIAMRSLETHEPRDILEFTDGICHRCNMTRPSLDYCHPMYGGQFMRGYGWYVNQTFYRLGLSPQPKWTCTSELPVYLGHPVIEEACPPKLLDLIIRDRLAAMAYRQESDRLGRLAGGTPRDDIAPDEITYWHNVKMDEATDYVRLRREAAQTLRAITTYVENLVRQEFGFRKVGEGWVSETLLVRLVARLLPGHEVVRHHRPDWLEGLELDIFLPDLLLGIEYQGQQHYHAIEAWGGDSALAALQQRDTRKVEICQGQGVTLLTVDYTEPLTEAHIKGLLVDFLDGRSV